MAPGRSMPSPAAVLPCSPPPGGPVPDAVPNGTALQSGVLLIDSDPESSDDLSGLSITCRETGVTLVSQCSGAVTFFFGASFTGQTVHFSTQAGMGTNCSSMVTNAYRGISFQVTAGTGIVMHVPAA